MEGVAGDCFGGGEFRRECDLHPGRATGRGPEVDPQTGALGFRPKDMKPIWVEVPMLYSLARWTQGLIPYLKHGASSQDGKPPLAQPPCVAAAHGDSSASREGLP